jgi:hypothetical protein
MPRPNLSELRNELLRSGISVPHVHRAVSELGDHFEDLVDAGVSEGLRQDEAEQRALAALGDLHVVTNAMREQPELKSWAWNHPRLAMIVYPLACVAALPAVPVRAGVHHAPAIARWAACLVIGGFVTAFMFLVLQLSISPI